MNQRSIMSEVFPLTVTFTGEVSDEDGPVVRTTGSDWPGLVGEGNDAAAALADFMAQIRDRLPLSQTFRSVLLDAGFGPEVIDAWATHVHGYRLTGLRHSPTEAVALLRAYRDVKVDGVTACSYMDVGLSPAAAGEVHAAGHTPTTVAPYVKALCEFHVDHHGDSVPVLWSNGEDDAVDWILSEYGVEAAANFAEFYMDVHDAREWEPVIQEHALNDDDLVAVRLLGWTVEEVHAAAETCRGSDVSIGETARTMLALQRDAAGAVGGPPF